MESTASGTHVVASPLPLPFPTFVLSGQTRPSNFFIITNLIHKFLVHSHKLHKIKFLYTFRAQSAHHQEVNDANCTYVTSGIVTLCK